MLRRAYVANQFYPGDRETLLKTVKDFLSLGAGGINNPLTPFSKGDKAIALIAPHAGYIYSGKTAGIVYAGVNVPDDVILIGPNHTGLGERAAVMTKGEWEIPLGKIKINEQLSHLLLDSSPLFSDDDAAHIREHSLEVQLPFLYVKNPQIKITPVTVMSMQFKECAELGRALKDAIIAYGKDVLIVVSSDMNHYESEVITKKKDKGAIEKILSLDAEGLLNVTRAKDITMCGVVPAAIAITAANLLRASSAKLVSYSTSGEVSNDFENVVGYAGVVIR